MAASPPEFFTAQTLLSLLSTILIVLSAYLLSLRLLPAQTSTKLRTFYIWHLADGITHLTLEASFLYNCFFVYTTLPASMADWPHPASLMPSSNTPTLYGQRDRAYGPAYGSNPAAILWQEYAKADARWGGADLTVISLEILTVGLAGPIALWVAELVRRGGGGGNGGEESGKMWFWAAALASGELYGGFMTFAPEWLSGNQNLDGSNFIYLWLYLTFFNGLWVLFPFWVLYEAYGNMVSAFGIAEKVTKSKKKA